MKTIGAIICLLFGIVTANAWTHGSAFVGTSYFISPTGSDSNNGLSAGSPWLTPNHAVNCGDTINAAAGTYNQANFIFGNWGAVANCPAPNGLYFAQLKCAGPSVTSCIINDTASNAMVVDKSNWAVVGWTASSTKGACFAASPGTVAATIHHIAFVNVIANGCLDNGVSSFTNFGGSPQFGVDYFAIVGAVAYNAAQTTAVCASGVSVYEPANFDTLPGTHIFLGGIFSFENLDPVSCASNQNLDGEGIIFDDWSHSQQTGSAYTGQGVIEQSMLLYNGSSGVLIFNNTAGQVFVNSTTSFGSYTNNPTANRFYVGELLFNGSTSTTQATGNLLQATIASVTGGNVYGCFVGLGGVNDVVNGNYCFGVGGSNTHSDSSPGFSFGSNTAATPNFVNPTVPSAPNCAGLATTTACMATTIANFTAQAVGAAGLGYQPPGSCTPDPLYPVWLKGIVPNGIITKPCGM